MKLTGIEEGLQELKSFNEMRSVPLTGYERRSWSEIGTQVIPEPNVRPSIVLMN